MAVKSTSPVRAKGGARIPSNALAAAIALRMDQWAFAWKVRRALYKHLSAQVGNKIPVERALEAFRGRLQRTGRVSSDKIIADVSRRMRDGQTLTKALGAWIPVDEVSIISSGELSGNLAQALDLLVESKERSARVIKAMQSALKKPLIYVALVYAFVWYLASSVLPEMKSNELSGHPSGASAVLFSVGELATSAWALLPPVVLIATMLLVLWSLPRWKGRARIKAERFFPYNAYRDVQGYAWLMGFTALLRAGMTDVAILKSQCENASPWLRERLHAIWWRMDDGASLPSALAAKGKGRNGLPPFGFPNPDVVDDIGSMAGFSDFPVRIAQVATTWANELEEGLLELANRIGFWAEVVLYILMTALVYAINSMSNVASSVPNF